MEEGDKSVTGATLHLAASTSLHGPSHIVAKKTLYGKLLWLVVMLVAFGMLVWQFTTMVKKFYTYPVSTASGMEHYPRLDFPAVTICNVNPIRKSQMHMLSAGLQGVMQKTHARPDSMKGADLNQPKGDMQTQNDFYQLYSLVQPQDRDEVGHQLDNMLIDCMWKGRQCTTDNFTRFTNWKYGNCFTFNQGSGAPTEISRDSGPLYGLHLTLFIEEAEYVKELTSYYGIKVVIHNQTDMPFPEDSGFFIPPGQATAVGLKLTSISREDPPHGECYNVTRSFMEASNAFLKVAKNLQHTHKTCTQTCLQQRIIEACNCTSYKYPNAGPTFSTLQSSGYSLATCNDTGTEYGQTCMGNATRSNARSCQQFDPCPVQCLENLYSTIISMMKWPSDDNLQMHLDDLRGLANDVNDTVMLKKVVSMKAKPPGDQMTYIRKNVIVLKIYYEDFYVQSYATTASYGPEDLLSDLGGTFGLWMGLSVITVFEFIEFFIDVIRLMTASKMRNKKTASQQPEKTEGKNDVSQFDSEPRKDDIELTRHS